MKARRRRHFLLTAVVRSAQLVFLFFVPLYVNCLTGILQILTMVKLANKQHSWLDSLWLARVKQSDKNWSSEWRGLVEIIWDTGQDSGQLYNKVEGAVRLEERTENCTSSFSLALALIEWIRRLFRLWLRKWTKVLSHSPGFYCNHGRDLPGSGIHRV